jgi:hypothetical protein
MSIVAHILQFGELVKKAMEYVTSADKAYHWLQEQGFDITRSIVREVWREVGQKEYWETVINTWGGERPIPRAWVVDIESKEAKGLYQIVKEQWYNPETGKLEDVVHSYKIDQIRAWNEFEDDVYDLEYDYAQANGYVMIGIWNGGVVNRVPKRR